MSKDVKIVTELGPGVEFIIVGSLPSFIEIQWGSEIRTSLDSEWSKRCWVANGVDFEWDLKSGSPTIRNPYKWPPSCQKPFEFWTKMSGFCMVQFLNGWDYSQSQ